MNPMITKHFGEDLSLVTDEQVKAKVAELAASDPVEAALLRSAIKKADGVQFRRLRMALGMDVGAIPLNMGNVQFMTDSEILQGFKGLDADAAADFAAAAFGDETPQGERAQRVLSQIKASIDAEKQRLADEAETQRLRLEAEAAEREALHLLEHPEELVREGKPLNIEQALSFIGQQPFGYFRGSADVLAMITDPVFDEKKLVSGTVIDMMTGQIMDATAAAVIRNCFLTSHDAAKQLIKLLDPRPGVKKERFFPVTETLSWFQGNEEVRLRTQAEEATRREEAKQATDALIVKVEPLFDTAADVLTVVRIYLGIVAEEILSEADQWKLEVIEFYAGRREYELVGAYKAFLRQTFPTAKEIEGLQAHLAERQDEYRGYKARKDSGEQGAMKLAEKSFILLQIATRHLQWVQDNPEGFVQKDNTEVIPFVRPRAQVQVGTHAFTKGQPGAPVFTNHSDPEAQERKRLNRRNADKQFRQDSRGSGASGNGGKGKGGKKGK